MLGRTVDEMLESVSSSELAEWEIYSMEESFGRQDFLLASLLQHIHNYLRGENDPPLRLEDILFPKPQPKATAESDKAQLEALARTPGVRDLRRNGK